MIRTLLHTLLFIAAVATVSAQAKHLVTARDCVETKYLLDRDGETALRINPQGDRIAYMVKSPNLRTNDNDVSVYVRTLNGDGSSPSKLIVNTSNLSQLIWLADGRHFTALAPVGGRIAVVRFNSESGERDVLTSSHRDIEEYSIDHAGNTIVFAIRENISATVSHSEEETINGYLIPGDGASTLSLVWRSERMPYRLWVQKRTRNGRWTSAAVVTLRSPFSGKPLSTVGMSPQFALSLSPNGQQLLVNLADIDMAHGTEVDGAALPKAWIDSPTFKRRRSSGGLIWITLLHDLSNGKTSMPFPTPSALGVAKWSPDGATYYVVATSPVGSDLEAREDDRNPSAGKPWHLWRVDPTAHHGEQILSNLPSPSRAVLWVDANEIGVRTGTHQITTLVRGATGWAKQTEVTIGPDGYFHHSDLASNGHSTAIDYQRTDLPPSLLIYKEDTMHPWATVNLNPQFTGVQFASARPFTWTTSGGTSMEGTLLLPPDYHANERYPLVIQTKPQQSDFVCDAGQSHFPSFAPQPMASQGLLYLSFVGKDYSPNFPKGYPGGIGEAVFYADVWDSAVKELDRQGIVNPDKVGLIGFSRSGWYTEFALFHGSTRFAAATATDNVQYGLEGYWHTNTPSAVVSSDAIYGGPPYGDTLRNWMRYSISFNLERIHTPLLLEAMGYGVTDDKIGSVPLNLSSRYEIATGLRRLGKPVELYYYPSEQHQPDHPRARLASLQRNIDWYRFWLQGYERPEPEDPDQYRRWKDFRKLQERAATH
jgi:dipeptidyl aminopeptidase/acylaminoacyl peptidase